MGSGAQAARDTVFLDVGGSVEPGILDQHQGGSGAASTAELVYSHPEFVYQHLLGRWLDRYEAGDREPRNWRFSIVTHAAPDFDALTAIWLSRHLVETGEFPPIAGALVAYTSLVDQGRYQVDISRPRTATHAVHMAYLAIQNLAAPAGQDRNAWCITLGLSLLDAFAASVSAATVEQGFVVERLNGAALYPGRPGVDVWRTDPRFKDAVDLLDSDFERYQADRAGATKGPVSLPASDGRDALEVNAFISAKPPESKLNKYWVRAEGYIYFVCPYGAPDQIDGKQRFPRVVISVDPTWSDSAGRKPNLRGLGFALERAECVVRAAAGGDERSAVPRWNDGSTTNSDPWYDGRGHEHTIVDAPSSGTFLPFEVVKAIATGGSFWHLPLSEAEVWLLRPVRGSAPVGGGQAALRPPRPAGTMRTLDAWFADCVAARMRGVEEAMAVPQGLRVASVDRRAFPFPDNVAPPMELVRLERDPRVAPTLEAVVEWAGKALRPAAGGGGSIPGVSADTYVFVRVGVPPHRRGDKRVEALLRRFCVGGTVAAGGDEDGELAIFNGRAVALRPPDTDPELWSERSALLVEILLYAAFQAEALGRFSTLAANAIVVVRGKTRVTGNAALQQQFLLFQAKYFHAEVVRDDLVRQVYQGLRESLGLDRLHDKVGAELDRLDRMEKEEAQEKTERLLFLVGLTGIVQAFTVGIDDIRAAQWALVVAALVISLVYYSRINRRTA